MKRWFSLALVLTMCFTMVLGDVATAFADDPEGTEVNVTSEVDITTEAVDPVVSFAASDGETEDEESGLSLESAATVQSEYTTIDVEDDSGDDPEISDLDIISDSEQATVNSGNAEQNDGLNADEDVAAPWYARARISLTLDVEEGVGRTVPAGSVLLVTEAAGEGLVRVACVNLSGVVDESALERLSDEEVQSFMDGLAQLEAVSLYNDDLNYPLPPEPTDLEPDPQENTDDAPRDDATDETAPETNAPEEDGETENAGDDGETGETEAPEAGEDPEDEAGEPEASEEAEDADDTANPEDAGNPEADEADTTGDGEDQTVLTEADSADKAEALFEAAGTPAAISLNLGAITLGLKESFTGLTGTVVDANGAAVEGAAVTWNSSNVRVVKVDATGKLTAVRRGKATIVASVEGLPQATVAVIVKKAPSKVTLKPKKANISIGMGLQLTAKLSKGSASGQLTFTSSNPGVAQVDANGLVTGVGLGKATITVRTYNKKRATCKVSVFSEAAAIGTDKDSYAILQGATQKMVISIVDAAGIKTYANLNIVSSDPNCVAVDGTGKIYGVNIGTATVTITTHNGLSIARTVDVCGLPADMALSASTITIGVREKYNRLTYTLIPPEGQDKCAAKVTWKSKNKKIAKVNSKTGVITGVKAGTTTIIATTNNKISRKVKVVVQKKPKSVALSPKELALTAGMTRGLSASYNGKNHNDNLTYTTSDPNVAVVDQNGNVTAVSRGSAIITAKTYNGKKDTCTVNVYDLPAQVMMTGSITLAVGMTGQMECSVVDANGLPSIADYSFSAVAESGSVQVDGSGRVTAQSVGTARVRVSTQNGVTTHVDGSGNAVVTECVVTIVEAPSEIRIDGSVEIEVGGGYTFSPKMYTPDGKATSIGSYELSASGDTGAISISGNSITGLAAGQVAITATTYNGHTATCQVKVTRRYRMFAVYDYYNVPEKGSLTFPMNNAVSFQEVLSSSSIAGIKYENLGLLQNPTKDAMLSGIANAFSDSRDSDVSVIYLVSHGINKVDIPKSAKYTHYGLQLPGYTNYKCSSAYYVTSEEIFNAISSIRGQVILVLDSCFSGQFITNMKSSLNAAGGRISVMTAATNTRACYYNISNTSTACDFFTMYLLQGAGYNMRTHQYTGAHPADTNKDGKLTFNEMFNYAKKNVKNYVPKYKNKSWFHGDPKQAPNVYKGNNGDLVLFQYA